MRYLLILFILLGFGPANARPISSVEKISLAATVSDFTVAITEKDMMAVFRVLPDRILNFMATQANLSSEEFLQQLNDSFGDTLSNIEFRDIDIRFGSLDLIDTVHEDGSLISYGFVPFSFEISLDGKTFRQETELIALFEDGVWYLLRFAEVNQVLLLQEVYSFLVPLQTAATTVTRVPN